MSKNNKIAFIASSLSLLVYLLAFFFAANAHAQLPEAPQPVKESHKLVHVVDYVLLGTDAVLRTEDMRITYNQVTSGQGYYESDPLAPSGKNLVTASLFHYSIIGVLYFSNWMLERHHHYLLGKIPILADIISESWAIQHNLGQHPAVVK